MIPFGLLTALAAEATLPGGRDTGALKAGCDVFGWQASSRPVKRIGLSVEKIEKIQNIEAVHRIAGRTFLHTLHQPRRGHQG